LAFRSGKENSTSGYFKLRIHETAEHLTSTQPPSRLNGSCYWPRGSWAKQKRGGGEGSGIRAITINFYR